MNRRSQHNPYSHPLKPVYALPVEHRAALDALILAMIDMDTHYPPPRWVTRFEYPRKDAA